MNTVLARRALKLKGLSSKTETLWYKVTVESIREKQGLYHDPNIHLKTGDLSQRAHKLFEMMVAKLHQCGDIANYMAKWSIFPILLNDNHEPIEVVFVQIYTNTRVSLHEWMLAVDTNALTQLTKNFVQQAIPLVCAGVFHNAHDYIAHSSVITKQVHALAEFPMKALALAMRGIVPTEKNLKHVMRVEKFKLPGHTWSWFAAIYVYLPAILAERFQKQDGKTQYYKQKTFDPHMMTCAACRKRLMHTPQAVRFVHGDGEKYREAYLKTNILNSNLCYMGVVEPYSTDDKIGYITTHCDADAMRCLAMQVQFTKVLSHVCNLEKAYCMSLWPGCTNSMQASV